MQDETNLPGAPKHRARRILIGLIVLGLLGVGGYVLTHQSKKGPHQPATASTTPPAFNKKQYSLDKSSSIWVVVNKGRALAPIDYAPTNLMAPNVPLRLPKTDPEMQMNADAAHALESLFAAAQADGLKFKLSSGYRSYKEQIALFSQYAAQQGQASANRESAHAGHSEHQTGLAADVAPADGRCVVQQCFANTAEGKWLVINAATFGFVIRYQAGKENVTGYEYEPWHIRFVGQALASELKKTGQTMEEFFSLPAIPLDS
ncbi:MAG: peptidase [Candidatus Saccharibacteria bacterium]|nr:peptidase [Candidatus Saccharibacteria bacterium]